MSKPSPTKRNCSSGSGIVGTRKSASGEYMFDHLRLDLDARQRRIDWRRPKVEQTGRAGADEDDPARDLASSTSPAITFQAGMKAAGLLLRNLIDKCAFCVGRDLHLADAHVV